MGFSKTLYQIALWFCVKMETIITFSYQKIKISDVDKFTTTPISKKMYVVTKLY